MKITKWVLIWLIVVVILILVEIGQITGAFALGDLITNFFIFVFALVIIAVLAVIGAMFVGVFISHRILSSQGFTPFEREMLKMREEIREIKEKLDSFAKERIK